MILFSLEPPGRISLRREAISDKTLHHLLLCLELSFVSATIINVLKTLLQLNFDKARDAFGDSISYIGIGDLIQGGCNTSANCGPHQSRRSQPIEKVLRSLLYCAQLWYASLISLGSRRNFDGKYDTANLPGSNSLSRS